jgi:hypothetical protein
MPNKPESNDFNDLKNRIEVLKKDMLWIGDHLLNQNNNIIEMTKIIDQLTLAIKETKISIDSLYKLFERRKKFNRIVRLFLKIKKGE